MIRPGAVSAENLDRTYPKIQKQLGLINICLGVASLTILVAGGMFQTKEYQRDQQIRARNDVQIIEAETELETDLALLQQQRELVDAQAKYGVINSGTWRLEGYYLKDGKVPLKRLDGLNYNLFTIITDHNTECAGAVYKGVFYSVNDYGTFVCAPPPSMEALNQFIQENGGNQ